MKEKTMNILGGMVLAFCIGAFVQGCENFKCDDEPPEIYYLVLSTSALFLLVKTTMKE